jgi:inhibitor of KinA sporulation pathway (predicted exonuclease)
MRKCTKCKMDFELSAFCRDAQKRDGLSSHCKSCKLNASRKLRGITEDRYFAFAKKYESSTDRVRAWRLSNPEAHAASIARRDRQKLSKNHKTWRDKNLHEERARLSKWRSLNPALMASYEANRRSKKTAATPTWANRSEIVEIYKEARRITRETGVKHVVDHMVPLSSKNVCGLHTAKNLQVVPDSVNASKGNRVWPEMP